MNARWNAERKAWVFVSRSVRTSQLKGETRRKRKAALLKLYGPHCWLCNRAIESRPTIDHVVPRSLGGTHALENLRLAHFHCNQRRADGPVPELLLTKAMRAVRP